MVCDSYQASDVHNLQIEYFVNHNICYTFLACWDKGLPIYCAKVIFYLVFKLANG